MNVSLDKTGAAEGIIKVAVEPADYADKVKKELKRISETHVIPGFRKGKAPMDMLRRRFGKSVKSEVINDTVYREVVKYIDDNKLDILGEPLPVEVKEINLDEDNYTFEYEVGMAPKFDLTIDKSIKLPYYTIEVTDDMRAEQDKAMRERMGAQVPGEEVDERALVKGAIMELNPDGTVNEAEGAIQVINGIVAPFYFKDRDEAAKFIGKKVGDKVVFNPHKTCDGNATELSSMLNVDKDKAAGITADFEMAISEIIVLKPAEHGQEYYDNVFGKDKVHNEDEYKTALTDMIARSLSENSRQLFAKDARDYFIDKCKGAELPDGFLKKWLVARNPELTKENIDDEYAKMRDSLVWQLAKGEISRQLDVKVEEADLKQAAKMMAYQQFAQYGMTNMDDTVLDNYADHMLKDKEYRQRIVENVSENKVYSVLYNTVTIESSEVSLDKFKELAQKA